MFFLFSKHINLLQFVVDIIFRLKGGWCMYFKYILEPSINILRQWRSLNSIEDTFAYIMQVETQDRIEGKGTIAQ